MQIYNTLSRRKEALVPLNKNHVCMYVCGITVYDHCHIGHARCQVAFDVIVRYLRTKGYTVTHICNITDIDDKIIQRAAENNEDFSALTERMIQSMHEDFAALGILKPDKEPRATDYIDEMILMIQTLIDKGYAYPAENGDVYYRVHRFQDYGKLSGKVLEELEAGARVETDECKENPFDFVLWKAAKPEEPSWSSPWSEGRPGWHIECSAMCKHHIGDTLDIHGGGPDLKFPHHENEIAQSEVANEKPFAKLWMHAGALRVDDEKMSKSTGNFFTIKEVLASYAPETVRYFLISSQYRSHINYSEDNLKEAEVRLKRLYTALKDVCIDGVTPAKDTVFEADFSKAMDDDFNTPGALGVLFELVREINSAEGGSVPPLAALLVSLGGTLGILQSCPDVYLQSGAEVDVSQIEAMIAQRAQAKKNRDFAAADQIRDELARGGVQLLDSRDGTTWQVIRRLK